jgi:preprotein translocase subunit YajC
MIFEFILLQATGSEGTGMANGGWINFAMIGAIIVVFYFFMIRPQQKRQKEEKEFRDGLKKGDKVITIGGIYGKIASIEANSILVEVDANVKVKMEKSAVKPVPQSENEQ